MDDFPERWKQLTFEGVKQMYSVGQFIEKRYGHLFSGDSREVQVKTSHRRRCIMSAQCVVAAAFPPKFGFIQEGLNWQPIPVKINSTMLWDSVPCKEADKERKKVQIEGDGGQFNRNQSDFYDYIEKVSGLRIENTTRAFDIYDRLNIARNRGLPLPSWATEEVMQRLLFISENDFFFRGGTEKILKLRIGPFFKDFTRDFQNRWSTKKFLVYSSHDVLLAMVLNALNQYEPRHLVKYGSVIFFEQHILVGSNSNDYDDKHFIKIFYLKDSEKNRLVELKACPNAVEQTCSQKRFIQGLSHLIINNWTEECGN
jgi:hypothetical protein